MTEPTNVQIQNFIGVYESAYLTNRRATSGSIQTLKELRKRGYKLGILTNGQVEDQTIKSRDIGVADLVDSILTSEGFGSRKPSQDMFTKALEFFGRESYETVMVGDDKKDDVGGSLKAGISPILYDPSSSTSVLNVGDKQVLVIQEMMMLLSYL